MGLGSALVFAVFTYIGYLIFKIIRYWLNKEPAPVTGAYYTDDEPDGSNYVTMPDGERRLD
jgi:hypothetical protein